MLIQVLAMVLTEFSVGCLLLVSLLPPREIRLGFFTLNSLLCAVACRSGAGIIEIRVGSGLVGCSILRIDGDWGNGRVWLLQTVWLDGRVTLVFSGLVGLLFGLLPFAGGSARRAGFGNDGRFYLKGRCWPGHCCLGPRMLA